MNSHLSCFSTFLHSPENDQRRLHPVTGFILFVAGIFAFPAGAQEAGADKIDPPAPRPKLVIQITVDQLRGDVLPAMATRLGGGLGYLLEHGVDFRNAHYRHSTTFTATGHATLLTGGNPAEHGMVGNGWFDPKSKSDVYCVDDPDHRILDGKLLKTTAATSPRNLLSTTIGDELVLASGKKSRVYSVSGKDRSAIISGGKLGKAFWYNPDSGQMVTSSYYGKGYPDWAEQLNQENNAAGFRDRTWALAADASTYRYEDDRAAELGTSGLGKTFPHEMKPVAELAGEKFPGVLRFTPYLDELVAGFATALIEHESLGSSDSGATDFLALGLSSVDYIGHAWGPLSREYEDAVLHLDALLGDFFAAVDSRVGLENTLLVLSSDHGASPAPEAMAALGFPAGRIDTDQLIADANEALRKEFSLGEDEKIILRFSNPSLYFDLELLEAHQLDPDEVENAAASLAQDFPGIAHAFSRTQLMNGSGAGNPLFTMAQRSFHPERSGDVVILQEPFWYLYKDLNKYAGMHGSPYPYDTHVPIIFAGLNLRARTVQRSVAPRDIAPTICRMLHLTAPTGCVGDALPEVFENLAQGATRP